MGLFLASADQMYGPITTLRRENRLVKHIPWTAFKMTDPDWLRVIDARDILGVKVFFNLGTRADRSVRIQIGFSSTSPLKSNQPSGVHFRLLKNFSHPGRRNEMPQNMPCTGTPSPMALQRSGNIIQSLMRSLVSF